MALGSLSLVVIARTLQDYESMRAVFVPTSFALLVAAVVALVVGLWRPAPVVLSPPALVQTIVGAFGLDRWLRLEIKQDAAG